MTVDECLTRFQKEFIILWGEKIGKNHHVQKETVRKKFKTLVRDRQFKELVKWGYIRRYKAQKRTDFCLTDKGWAKFLELKKERSVSPSSLPWE